MQQALEWQEILEIFYNFDTNEVYHLPNVDGINEKALKLGLCAILQNAGFQTEASRLWASLVCNQAVSSEHECTRENEESNKNAVSSHPVSVADNEFQGARTPLRSINDNSQSNAFQVSSDMKSNNVDMWLANGRQGEQLVEVHSNDNLKQLNLNAASDQVEQARACSEDTVSSDKSELWLNDWTFRREQ